MQTKSSLVNTASCLFAAVVLVTGLVAFAEDRLGDRFKELDTNSDDKVTPDELPQTALFQQFDLDRNGSITLEEARESFRKSPGTTAETLPSSTTPSSADTSKAAPVVSPVRQGPKLLTPGEHGIGGLVADAEFVDLNGRTHHFSDFSDRKATVIAMTSTSCPLSRKYLPTLVELAKTYSARGVIFVLVNPVATDEDSDMKTAHQSFGDTAIYVADLEENLARTVGAKSTTDVVVMDPSRTVVYHGAIDDQYGFGYSIEAPRSRYLADAIDAVLDGKLPAVAATAAPGCVLDIEPIAGAVNQQTYHGNIERLVQRHCLECHRDGGVGPFALDTYKDIVAHAPMIKDVVERGVMPPWFAATGSEDQISPWANDRSLAKAEKSELLTWLASDRPLGDPKDAPAPRKFAGEWTIGQPDLIVQLPEPMKIKAQGTMPYQFVTAETTLTEDRWVQGYEIVPTDRSVVHHVIVNVHAKGSGRIRDREEGIGGYWAAYVPGNTLQVYPPGFARKLPAGAVVSFQIHYTPNGKATQDQMRMGLIFAKEEPKYIVETLALADRDLNIPAGDANHIESFSRRLPRDINVLAYMAHMHVRGKSFQYQLTTADGKSETLLDIPHYDFNWQLRYDYAQPRVIPAGSTVKVTAVFDNSTNNPANPDPTRTVGWGPQTFDEMMIGYVEAYRSLSDPADTSAAEFSEPRPGFVLGALFKRMDSNGDGQLTGDEIPEAQKARLMRLDSDKDGGISLEEAKRLRLPR